MRDGPYESGFLCAFQCAFLCAFHAPFNAQLGQLSADSVRSFARASTERRCTLSASFQAPRTKPNPPNPPKKTHLTSSPTIPRTTILDNTIDFRNGLSRMF